MPTERFKLVPTSHLILVRDGRILLLRRFNTGYEDGNYSVVAGHLDGNETFIRAMAREAMEEAGIRVRPEDMEVVHVMHRKSPQPPAAAAEGCRFEERIDFFIRALRWEGEPRNLEPHKCDDLRWFPLDGLPQNTIPYVRQAIGCFRKGILYSEHGW
jgi:8-oxo-dGTP diphosphatase